MNLQMRKDKKFNSAISQQTFFLTFAFNADHAFMDLNRTALREAEKIIC